MKPRCLSTYSGETGWPFSCDLTWGHPGLHRAEDYDSENDCFRQAEWLESATDERCLPHAESNGGKDDD